MLSYILLVCRSFVFVHCARHVRVLFQRAYSILESSSKRMFSHRHHEPSRAVPKVAVKTTLSIEKRHPSSSHHQQTSQVCLPRGRVPNNVLAKQAPAWPPSGGLSNTRVASKSWSHGSRELLCGTMKSTPLVKNTSGTIISVNQLCIYGAVTDMCDELACRISDCSERTRELEDNPETAVIPTELMTTNKSPRTDENVQGNLLHNSQKNWKSSTTSIDQAMLRCRYHEDRSDRTHFHDPRQCGNERIGTFMSRVHFLRDDPSKWKDGFVGTRRSVQLWKCRLLIIKDVTNRDYDPTPYLAMELVPG